jgi:Replication-relaxation
MSAYLSRQGLDRLRENLSNRDLTVIHSVHEHRFLTALQIEALHFADHSTPEAGARVCRRVLARLTRERLLARLQRRVGGVRAGSSSFVYALGPVGGRLVADGRRLTEPSLLFLDHTLAVAEARIELVRADRVGTLDLAEIEVEPACWRRYTGPGGAAEIVRPDLYVVTRQSEFEDCWFVEIDRGTESPAAIGRKCRAYQAYWRTGREQDQREAFPLVLWVTPKEPRAQRIEKVISGTRNLKQDLFRVTTAERFVQAIAGGAA